MNNAMLEIRDLYFENCNFERKNKEVGVELFVAHKPKIDIDEKNNTIIARLSIKINDEKKSFEVNTTILGEFYLNFENLQNVDNDEIIQSLRYQILMILYPSIRAQITILTSMPGFTSIILPLIDVRQLIEAEPKKKD